MLGLKQTCNLSKWFGYIFPFTFSQNSKSEDLKELVKMWHARDIPELNLYSCFEKGDWATIVIHSSGTGMVSVILISSGIQGPIILTQPSSTMAADVLGPLLLTWINFNPSINK